MDDYIKAVRKTVTTDRMSPRWDDEREEALLSRVLAETEGEVPGRVDPIPGRGSSVRPALRWVGAGGLVAAAAALALFLWPAKDLVESPGSDEAIQSASLSPEKGESVPAGASELNFSQGTRALLDAGSKVTTLAQTEKLISLRQESGRVSYEVNPEARQRFQVLARDVVVEVLGTQFDVSVEEAGVRVEVSRGTVSVKNEERSLILRKGESVLLTSKEAESSGDPGAMEEKPAVKSSVPAKSKVTVETLLADADEARRGGDLARAEAALRRVATEFSSDGRSVTALFSLGRVQRARGKAAEAAQTFASVRKRAPGALGEDALAEEAISRAQAGQRAQATALAKKYLQAHPSGIHRGRLEKLLPQD